MTVASWEAEACHMAASGRVGVQQIWTRMPARILLTFLMPQRPVKCPKLLPFPEGMELSLPVVTAGAGGFCHQGV